MVCPILGQGNLEATDTWYGAGPTKIEHTTANTSNSLVQAYLYATEKMPGSPVGFGSDIPTNGFAALPGPRFAPHNGAPNEIPPSPTTRLRYPFRAAATGKMMSRSVVGPRAFDFNRDGLAHIGMLPDLIADLQAWIFHRGDGGRPELQPCNFDHDFPSVGKVDGRLSCR